MIPIDIVRGASGLVYGTCEHDREHSLWASADWMARQSLLNDSTGLATLEEYREHWLDHYCCPEKCCEDPEWQVQTCRESVTIANGLIMDHKEKIKQLTEDIQVEKLLNVLSQH